MKLNEAVLVGPPEPAVRHDGVDDALAAASDALELRMLGPLEAWQGGRRLALGGQRQRSVLACLMLDPGHDVSADRIVDAIWGERPPSGVSTTLQTYVFHLREVLEPARTKGAPASVVVTVPGGYRLDATKGTIDARRFEELVRSGRAALTQDPQSAASVLAEALALWRGDVLSDLVSLNGLVAPVASRLTELRGGATEAWVAAELALGHHDTVLPILENLVDRHPLREHLATLRMLALYRAGRQSESLDAYRQLRRTLDVELGIRPSGEVETMHQQVLRQDPLLTLPLATARSAVTKVTKVTKATEVAPAVDAGLGPPEPTPSRPSGRGYFSGVSRRGWAAIVAVGLVAGAALVVSTVIGRRGDITPLPANSIGPIDAVGLRGDAVALAGAPSALTGAGGAVWAVLESADAVVKIDPQSRTVVDTVPHVGGSPQAVATSGDDL
ncbi:MAG: AfsR/SARP family transcriptional regulator [Lapillicoccus sp.]